MKLDISTLSTILSLPVFATTANAIIPRQDPAATGLDLASTNPTAVPLASITQGAATQVPGTLASNLVPTPGAVPPIPGAPAIPNFVFSAGSFPALDEIPPIDSPQVQQWIQEVKNSGIQIPTFAPTTGTAGCAENPEAAADKSRCWWTCGQCTRPTDITTCPDKFTWGLSFDDGPSEYTPDLLDYLDVQQIKSTFFVVGSRAVSRPQTLQAEHLAGHQISVHTWSHPSLTTLSNEQIIAELGWTREAIKQITGVSPNTMRPPYGDIDDRVRAIAMAMGMTPIIWTGTGTDSFDTNDWHIPSGQSSISVLQTFDKILDTASTLNTGFIVLAHDLYQQTVDLAIGYVLPDALARRNPQFNLQSIISCLHKPLGDAYEQSPVPLRAQE
ncbi:chitin deacetylase [Tulasnella sp. 419]|nr:chitin deacetylase [Tulasnella sp. 419]